MICCKLADMNYFVFVFSCSMYVLTFNTNRKKYSRVIFKWFLNVARSLLEHSTSNIGELSILITPLINVLFVNNVKN